MKRAVTPGMHSATPRIPQTEARIRNRSVTFI
jgi:hypothetical protein